MFQGYTDETFEFFMAIRFNNNTDFFHSNHDWYKRAVREPSLALAEALSSTVETINGDLERRPNRVVSRINRDIRFSRDKSPYRDYLWLSFKHTDKEREGGIPGLYFEISANGAGYGMGFYRDNRPLTNALRRRILTEPERILELLLPIAGDFRLYANLYKRMTIPAEVPEPLRALYPAKGFYFEKELNDFSLLKSPALAEEIKDGFLRLAPLCRYLYELAPECEEDPAVQPIKP